MKGKIGIAVGFAAGYVLGSRAGRERYEQIKSQFLSVWNSDPVQKQVGKAKEFGKSAAMALPSTIWDGAVKVTKAAGKPGTTSEKLDAAVKAGKQSASNVAEVAKKSAAEAKKAASQAADDVEKALDS